MNIETLVTSYMYMVVNIACTQGLIISICVCLLKKGKEY